DGRVSTPVGNGQGQAVVIQPSGDIVTVGWRGTAGIDGDFALTRHDPLGQLDPTFGTLGLTVTDLGGKDDEAQDAALMPDGGIIAVGRTDKSGTQTTDFALVRYQPDGTPDPNFGSGGIMSTDVLAGHGSQANAVAVQPDGKIVVAGLASPPPRIDSAFAL